MIYEYQNARGEHREIVASMRTPPSERVVFDGQGQWHFAGLLLRSQAVPGERCLRCGRPPSEHEPGAEFTYDCPDGDRIFRRVYTAPQAAFVKANRGAIDHPHQKHKGLPPTSVSLPRTREVGEAANLNGHRVRKLKCGGYATMQGKRIVDSKEAGDRHAADCGYVRITDE